MLTLYIAIYYCWQAKYIGCQHPLFILAELGVSYHNMRCCSLLLGYLGKLYSYTQTKKKRPIFTVWSRIVFLPGVPVRSSEKGPGRNLVQSSGSEFGRKDLA